MTRRLGQTPWFRLICQRCDQTFATRRIEIYCAPCWLAMSYAGNNPAAVGEASGG